MAAHQAPPSLGFSSQEHWEWVAISFSMHESEKWKWSRSVVSDSLRPHGLQPTKFLCPCDFPGKCTGVGCHCLLQIILLWTYESVCVWTCFIFFRYLEVKLLGHIITRWLRYFFGHAMEYVGFWFPDQGSNPKLMHWKDGVFTLDCQGSPVYV